MSNKEKKDAAMDQLFGGLTMPSSPSSPSDMPQEPSQTLSPRQKKYQEENERITTIVNTEDMNKALCEITGFAGISFQPNSGAAGEYSGLTVIRNYHIANGQGNRN